MQNYRIVVGYDGSDGGVRALNWAVAEAAQHGGTVQAISAWAWTRPDLGTQVLADQEQLTAQALDDAVAIARRPHPEVTVSTEAVPGPAAAVLTRAAAAADLLVLGSHGHGRLFHAVLGSVAEACVRQSVCPVVVIPLPHDAPKPAEPAQPAPPISTAVY